MERGLADFAIKFAQKKGCSYAEARLEHSKVNQFSLKNGVPQLGGFDIVNGLGVRFLIKNSLGFISTNELNKTNIQAMLEKAINSVKSSKINEDIQLSQEPAHNHTYEVKQKINFDDISPKEKIQILFEAEKAMAETKIKLPGRYLSLGDSISTEYLVTSEGTKLEATVPRAVFFYILTIQEGAKTCQRYWQYGETKGFEAVNGWNIPKLLTDEVKAMSNNLKNGIKPPIGNVDVVCAPQVVAIMVHESVGHPYEADRILGREAAQAGESFVTPDMIGQKIGSEIVNVIDDPTIPNSYGFYLYDNEGVKAKRKFLMKGGKINEFLHNRQTAAAMGLKSNGSSRAVDYDKESIVRMSNTILLPGDHSEEELIEDVKLGIYMKNFMEWNIDDKRLNQKYTGAESYLIKNGEIKDPIISPTIEINTPKLWSSVSAIAKNTEYHSGNCGKGEPIQGIPVWFGGPSMLLRGVQLK